jgi:Cu+-exporting ATPase
VRNAEALETLARVDTLVVDKTGTLTQGRPQLFGVLIVPGSQMAERTLLSLAASLEKLSEHPLARAIVRAAEEQKLPLAHVTDFKASPGGGVRGRVLGKNVVAGTARFLAEQGVPMDFRVADASNPTGGPVATSVFVAVDGRAQGRLALADEIKATARETIDALRKDGIHVVMLTGDQRDAANYVAKELGITKYEAEVLPQQKSEVVRKLRGERRIVAMAGDGINDAPALAAAHVGIAMGTGTDVAMESAGITLVKGDLNGIVRARKLARATVKNIKENLAFAFVYNGIGIPIAAGVLYPILGWLLSPMIASAAMSFSSVSVITNALRLRRISL